MRLLTLLAKELTLYRRDGAAIVLLLVLPIFFIWLFAQVLSPHLFTSRYSQAFHIAYVDEDQTFNTRMITRQLEELDYMKGFITVHKVEKQQALSMLTNNEIAGAILIPAGFTASLYSGDNYPVTFIGNRTQREQADQVKNQLISAMNDLSAGQSGVKAVWHAVRDGGATPQQLDRVMKESVMDFMLQALGRNEIYEPITLASMPQVRFPEYFTAALAVVFVSFLGIRGSRSLAEEKELGMLARFRAAPFGIWQVFAGKFLGMFLLLLMQTAVLVLGASIVFGNYLGGQPASFLLIFTATAFAVSAWAFLLAVLGLFSKGTELVGYVGTFFLAIIGGNIYPLHSLSDSLQAASEWTFTRWAMQGMLKLFSGDVSLSVWPEAGMLLSIGGVLLLVSGLLAPLARRT
ncbi:ABC transporter permease [Aneurinibacillus sp. BA2021]|nr:ABC transporter permease [Aneurinibacillus sp. BA2021]